MTAQEMNRENTNLDSRFNITWNFLVQVVLNTWFDCISVILLVVHLTCCNSMYISMGTLLMRILICQYLRPMCLHLRSMWILLWIFVGLDGSEWVLGESEFWFVWGSVFYLFCVRVTEIGEVGYGWVTMRITGGHIELEANHRWKKCNYPFF